MCDKTFTGFVTHVDGDGPFLQVWFTKSIRDSSSLQTHLEALSVLLEEGVGRVEASKLKIEQQIVVRIRQDTGNKWYRAKILNTNYSAKNVDSLIEVYYIDNGQTDFVYLSEIRSLDCIENNNVDQFPPLANEIYLFGVISSDKKQFWSVDTLESLHRNFCYRDAEFKPEFTVHGDKIFMSVKSRGLDIAAFTVQHNNGESIPLVQQKNTAVDYFMAKKDMMLQKSENNCVFLRQRMEDNIERESHHLQDQSNMCSQPCLKIGTSHNVYITCTQNGPCSFYVQCATDRLKLDELALTLNSVPLEPLKTSPHTGLPCTSRFDKNLSRAVIVSVTEDSCEIFLVDHGVRLQVPHHELYHLPEEFIHPISLAIRFKLSDIENIHIEPKICEVFSDLVQNKSMRLEITDVEENIQCCELYNDNNIKISDILKQHLSSHNVEYPAFDISDHLNCRVVTSYINTTSVFLPWSFSVNLESSILDIEDIMVQVNQYCQTEATIVPEIITTKRNEPIIAQYSKDDLWYRAKVLQNYNGKSATVLFVDYGHCEEVLPSATRPAPEKLINNLPPQAILCRLQHADNLPTAPSRLNQITNMKGFDMNIIQVLPTGECLVRMYDTSVYPVKDLAQDLIAFHSSLNINYPHQELYGQPQVNPYGMPPYNLAPGPRPNFPLNLHYYGQQRGRGVQIAKRIPRPLEITAPPPAVKPKEEDERDSVMKPKVKVPALQVMQHDSTLRYQREGISGHGDTPQPQEVHAIERQNYELQEVKQTMHSFMPRELTTNTEKKTVSFGDEIDSTDLYHKTTINEPNKSSFMGWMAEKEKEQAMARNKKVKEFLDEEDQPTLSERIERFNHCEKKQQFGDQNENRNKEFGNLDYGTQGGEKISGSQEDGNQSRGRRYGNQRDENQSRGRRYGNQLDRNADREKVFGNQKHDAKENKEKEFGNQGGESEGKDFGNQRDSYQGRDKRYGNQRDGNQSRGRRYGYQQDRNADREKVFGNQQHDASESKEKEFGNQGDGEKEFHNQRDSYQGKEGRYGNQCDGNQSRGRRYGYQQDTNSDGEKKTDYQKHDASESKEKEFGNQRDSYQGRDRRYGNQRDWNQSRGRRYGNQQDTNSDGEKKTDYQKHDASESKEKEFGNQRDSYQGRDRRYGNQRDWNQSRGRRYGNQQHDVSEPREKGFCDKKEDKEVSHERDENQSRGKKSDNQNDGNENRGRRYGNQQDSNQDQEKEFGEKGFANQPDKNNGRGRRWGNQQDENQDSERRFGNQRNESRDKEFGNQSDRNQDREKRFNNQRDDNRVFDRRDNQSKYREEGKNFRRNQDNDFPFNRGNVRSNMTPWNSRDNNQGGFTKQENTGRDNGENNTRGNEERGRFERQGKTSETKCQKYVEENWDLAPLPSIKPVRVTYSQINLQVGKEFEAIHVFANHPSDFFIQPIASASQLEDVMAKIVTFCDRNVSLPCVVQFDVDDLCLAQFSEDLVWYRAKVLSIEDSKCEVQFVDFGNTDNVYVLTQMKNMPSDLLELPAQAIRCSLRGVAAEKVWSVEETGNFASILDANTLKVTLVGLDSVNPPKYSVVIHQGDTCINEQYGASPTTLLPRTQLARSILDVGTLQEVSISWFLTPHNFHVQLKLSKMQREVLADAVRLLETPTLHNVENESLVIACKDKLSFRAKVLATKDNKARVYNLDVGKIHIVEINQLKLMPESMMETPAFAISCTLSEISPISGPEWPPNCKIINSVFQSSPIFNMKVVSIDQNDQHHVKFEAGGIDVATKLVELGVAVFKNAKVEDKPDKAPASEILQSQPSEPVKEQETSSLEVEDTMNEQVFVSYSKGLYVSLQYASLNDKLESMQEELQIAMEVEQLPLQPGDSSLVAAKNPEDETWYRAQLISPMNEEETGTPVNFVDYGNDDIVTEIRQLPTQFCNILPFAMPCILPLKPFSTEELNVKEMYDKIQDIIYEENITLTFKKYTTHENKFVIDLFLNNKSLIDTLTEEKLATSLIEKVYISTISESEFNIQLVKDEINIHEMEEKLTQEVYPDVSTVEVGKIYIAKYTEDNVWCRVKIIQSIENGFIANFIDYGNTAIVTEIKQLPEDLALLPPLSTLCVLTNIEDMDSLVEAANNGSVVQVLMSPSEERPMKISLVKDSSINSLINNEESSEMKQTEEILEITTCPDTYKDSEVQLTNTTPVTESDNVIQETKTLAVILESALLEFEAKQKKEAELISENTKEIKDVKLCSIEDAEKAQNHSEIRDHIESEEKEDVKLCSTEDTEIHDQIEREFGKKDVKSEDAEIIQNPSEIQEIKGEDEISETTKDKVTEIKVSTSNENLSTSTQADKEKVAEKIELTSTENIETNKENTKLINIRIIKYSKPDAFWCQNIDDLDKLTFIEESVSKLYSELLTTMEDGKLYAAQSNINKKWYRVRKLDTYYALFIDYGTLENVTNFTELSQELQEIPPLATHYSYDISNINPSYYHQLKDIITNPNTIFQASIYNNNKILSLFIDGENVIDILNQNNEMQLSEICLSHFDDLENFYVHEISYLHKIADLTSELQNTSTETIENVEIGTRCLAKYKADDNSWQRVDIISQEADNTFKVLLIDYGNTILASEFRKIPSDMFDIPPMAKRCHLLNIPNDESIRLQLTFLLVDSIFITFDANLSEYVEGTSLGINLMKEGENVMEKLKLSCKKTLLFDEKTTVDKSLSNTSNTEKSSSADMHATEIPCKDTQEVEVTETMSTKEVQDTEAMSTEEVQYTETLSTEEVQDTPRYNCQLTCPAKMSS